MKVMQKKLKPTAYELKLEKLRAEINKQDQSLLLVLKKRYLIVKKIANLKAAHKLSILQKTRWKTIIENRVMLGNKMGLDSAFTKKLMKLIHNESIRLQLTVKNKKQRKS
ncbi:MAG: chorismate mutase [Bacteriovoracaceae bacterium]|nr:chorismate mutase [Bacteriovoracaceae bacterium]